MGILDHPSSSGSTPGNSRGGKLGIDWAKWFPPVTSRTFLSHYLPASGAVSHTLYTVHLFSPNIISSLFPTGDLAVSNTILFNANVGLGFYVYFRKHLHRVNPWERVEFSVFASTLFNFGSLLAAVLIKALFPAKSNTWLKSLTATTLSVYLLSRAYRYMSLLDSSRNSRGSVSPSRSLSSRVGSIKSRKSIKSTKASSAASSASDDETVHNFDLPHNQHNPTGYMPLTPSATNYSATEPTISEFGEEETSEKLQNFRYLHSFALNNLNQNRPAKENILRRTTMNQKKKKNDGQTENNICFVTPEINCQSIDNGLYTPPPSVNGKSIKIKKKKEVFISEEKDDLDKFLDFMEVYGALALIPVGVGCFAAGEVPIVGPMLRFLM